MRNKRWLGFVSLFLLAIFLNSCAKDINVVKDVLTQLAQPAWDGRQVGTEGNVKAGEYLAGLLKEFDYSPFEGEDYFHTYKQTIPDASAVPSFKIIDSNNNEEVLEPGKDFTLNRGVQGFSFKGEVTNNPQKVGNTSQAALYESYEQLSKVSSGYGISVIKSNKIRINANGQNLERPYPVSVSPKIYDRFQNSNGIKIEIEYAPQHKSDVANNVVGVIKGTNSKKALILSAHYDGMASFGNVSMTSAYDNGSGIAALMETARLLSRQSEKKPFGMDIVICCFNGEEMHLSGSKAFAKKLSSRYEEMVNINIDCIGGKNCGALAMKPVNEESRVLYDAMMDQLKEFNISFNSGVDYGGSDQNSFTSIEMPVLVLGQEKVLDLAHTPDDKLENLDIDQIEKMSEVITDFVIDNDGKTFKGSDIKKANEDETDWEAVQYEADRLTKDINLKYNELFVFEYGGKKYQKTSYHPLDSEAELKEHYPNSNLPDFSEVESLKGYTLDIIDIQALNGLDYIEYVGEETGLIVLDLKQKDISGVILKYTNGNKAISITIGKTTIGRLSSEKVRLSDDFEDYNMSICYGDIEALSFEDKDKEQCFDVEYYIWEPIVVDGKSGGLIKSCFEDEEHVKRFINDFDFKNKGGTYYKAIFGEDR